MIDPQRRAVEAIAYWIDARELANFQVKNPIFEPDDFLDDAGTVLTALRAANLVILDRETVDAAVAVAKSFTPRWTEYECFTQMEEALRDG